MKSGWIAAMAPLALLAGTAAQAQTAPADAASAKPVKEKRICRSEDNTGSIVPKRTCHTKAEWSAIDLEQQRSVDTDALQRNQRR